MITFNNENYCLQQWKKVCAPCDGGVAVVVEEGDAEVDADADVVRLGALDARLVAAGERLEDLVRVELQNAEVLEQRLAHRQLLLRAQLRRPELVGRLQALEQEHRHQAATQVVLGLAPPRVAHQLQEAAVGHLGGRLRAARRMHRVPHLQK